MQLTSLPRTPRAAVALLPSAPGVYRFRDADNRVLYIGRAINLRRRVGSYWNSLDVDRRLARMVSSIARLEAVVCDSEHEACWLERNLLELESMSAEKLIETRYEKFRHVGQFFADGVVAHA